MLLVVFMLVCPMAQARDFQYGDTDTLGNLDWFVDSDGDILPASDSSQDVGASGNEINAIYSDNVYASGGESVFQQLNVGIDDGTGAAYYVNMTPGITSYATGTIVVFMAKLANTGACTLNVNGIGAKGIKKLNDQDLSSDHIEAGQMVLAIYDYTNSVWEILQPDSNP
jgi:hypothetical protein